jgi:hypothetical protein
MQNSASIKAALKTIATLRGALDKLERHIRALEGSPVLSHRRTARAHKVRESWSLCHRLYDEWRQKIGGKPTLREIFDALVEQKSRNPSDKRYKKLPKRFAAFAQYVANYRRVNGLPPHRERDD